MPFGACHRFLLTPRPAKHPAPLHFHFIYMVIEGNSSVAMLQAHPRFSLLNLLVQRTACVHCDSSSLSIAFLKGGIFYERQTSIQSGEICFCFSIRECFQVFHSR